MKFHRSAWRLALSSVVTCAVGLFPLVASVAQEAASQPQTPVTFEADIQPLLKAKCWKCHGEDTKKGELSLQTPAAIQKGSESGVIFVAGKSTESRLFEVVKHGEMPPDKKERLSDVEVELIRAWIDGGASFGNQAAQQRQVTHNDVIPILLLRCTVCHGKHKQEGGLDLRDRASMLRGGKSGPAFVSGKPDESLMIKRIRAEEMPPHARLTEVSVKPMEAEETKTLAHWIELGAPIANDEPELAGTTNDPLVHDQDRDFWSFRPPHAVTIPSIANQGTHETLRTPVDAFIGEKLSEKGLAFAAVSDRLTLLRRITFDLTGLPPTPNEAQEFSEDRSPDAFERVVDRLLASPRYGERWGRHWLDVAGYADCEGRREQHLPRPFAWRYRDYVIRSFNSDKPYDRFLLEQIAGDELADYQHAPVITQEIEDNLVATAFLRLSPDPTWANLTGFVPDRLEVTADSMDVLGSGVMGLTFKCARCHTHKFDPIPQRDYYRLVALFKGAYDEHDWLKPQLNSFGGALSAGLAERFLPHVTTEERKRWEDHQANIQRKVQELTSLPKTPELEKQIHELEAQRQPEPRVMALWDRGEPSPTYVYRRGNYLTSGTLVSPGVPALLSDTSKPFTIAPPWPGAKSTGRRLAFARWLIEPQHPLTARVITNRIWKHHFGQGIVRSLGNFGKTGERPTHPELLDYLARDFIRRGWNIKSLHRQLVLSATYQQTSIVNDRAEAADPNNVLLSRMPLQRLDAEELRDGILMVANELNDAGGGPSEPVKIEAGGLVSTERRRSIYVQQLRKHPPSLLESFDLPSMNPNCLQRSESLVPTQALHLWNDTAIRRLAERFAERVRLNVAHSPIPNATPEEAQVDQIYWIAIGRGPTVQQQAECIQTLMKLKESWLNQTPQATVDVRDQAELRALTAVCHTILNSADFLYID